jgi:hypothetical protein
MKIKHPARAKREAILRIERDVKEAADPQLRVERLKKSAEYSNNWRNRHNPERYVSNA